MEESLTTGTRRLPEAASRTDDLARLDQAFASGQALPERGLAWGGDLVAALLKAEQKSGSGRVWPF